jgi:drug/metabolite transporter (DMT)-like permease
MALRARALGQRSEGVLLAFVGVMCVGPDALLVRLISSAGLPQWESICWKYCFVAALQGAFASAHAGGARALWAGIGKGPRHIAFAAAAHTVVARALLFFSLNPLWAALFSLAVLREPLPRRTVLALCAALVSVCVCFLPTLFPALGDSASPSPSAAAGTTYGDLMGATAGAALGALITVGRSAKLHAPECSMLVATVLGSALVGLATLLAWLPSGSALSPMAPAERGAVMGLVIADSACVTACYVGMTLAPRLITSAEVALVLLLEMVFSPLYVYWALGEVPSLWTAVGCAMLLVALAAHEVHFYVYVEARRRGSGAPEHQLAHPGAHAAAPPAKQGVTLQRDGQAAPGCAATSSV